MGWVVQHGSSERGLLLGEMADALRRLESQLDEGSRLDPRPARHQVWSVRLRHWSSPGVDTPWWVFAARLGFWLLIGAGVETFTTDVGWHPDFFSASLGIVEVGWRARGKLRAQRSMREQGERELLRH